MGIVFCVILSNLGAAYGTAKAGVGILSSGVLSPDLIYKNLIPIIMAGVNGIYGLITAIVIINEISSSPPDDDGNNV
jgi:V-type H+-transporting ATPase proteolipid subunit